MSKFKKYLYHWYRAIASVLKEWKHVWQHKNWIAVDSEQSQLFCTVCQRIVSVAHWYYLEFPEENPNGSA